MHMPNLNLFYDFFFLDIIWKESVTMTLTPYLSSNKAASDTKVMQP